MVKKELNEALSEVLLPEGFYKKGSAFVKILEHDTLCVVRFDDTRRESEYGGHHFALDIGLESLYSELDYRFSLIKDWFLADYMIVNLIGEKSSMPIRRLENSSTSVFYEYSMEEQICILKDKGLPLINSIHSQKELLDALHYLQKLRFGHTLDNESVYALYLYLEEYEKAKNIVLDLWNFWKLPEESWDSLELLKKYAYLDIDNKDSMNELQIQHVYERNWRALQSIYRKWMVVKDSDRIKSLDYLNHNYSVNIEELRRVIPKMFKDNKPF